MNCNTFLLPWPKVWSMPPGQWIGSWASLFELAGAQPSVAGGELQFAMIWKRNQDEREREPTKRKTSVHNTLAVHIAGALASGS